MSRSLLSLMFGLARNLRCTPSPVSLDLLRVLHDFTCSLLVNRFTILKFPWNFVKNSKFHEVTSGPWQS